MAANNLINNSIITKEALALRRNTNNLVKRIDRKYEDKFAEKGAKIGDTLNIRLPNDYIVQDGPVVNPEATNERSIPLTVDYRKNVPMSFSTQQRTLNIDDFSRRYIAPAVNALVGQAAVDIMQLANEAINMIVTKDASGKLIAPNAKAWLLANGVLTHSNTPPAQRWAVIDPLTNAETVTGLSTFFNPVPIIGEQTRTGHMSSALLGVEGWHQDQTVLVSQAGSYDGKATATGTWGDYTPAGKPVNRAKTISAQNSPHTSELACSALGGTLKKGDVITIAGVNRINRVNKQPLAMPQQFVVLADCPEGSVSIPLSPAIIPPGANGPVPYQTVDAAPQAGAVISLVLPPGQVYRRNLVFQEEAMTLACVDLEQVDRGVVDCHTDNLDGFSMRTLTYYNGSDDTRITRLDTLYGIGMLRGDWVATVVDPIYGG